MPKVHIGKKIKEVLDRSTMRTVDFAKSINLSRNGAYKIFEKQTIDTGQLQIISKVLGHDFFTYYRQDSLLQSNEFRPVYGYVTKDELNLAMGELIKTLRAEIYDLRHDLSKGSESYKIKKKRKSAKKQLHVLRP
jgi:hypothetical protein